MPDNNKIPIYKPLEDGGGRQEQVEPDIPLRSEEIQEILEKMPHWLIRWGSLMTLLMILVVLLIAYMIKYPDVFSAPVMVSTPVPPETIAAGSNGRIEAVLANEGAIIQAGLPVVVLENMADYREVFRLKQVSDTIDINRTAFPFELFEQARLGSVETWFIHFRQATRENKDPEICRTFLQLKKAIRQWYFNYVIRSSISGVIRYAHPWKEDQQVRANESLAMIAPPDPDTLIARGRVTAKQVYALKVGQKVSIRLDHYPADTFGMVGGTLSAVSPLPDRDGYFTFEVILPRGLETSYKGKLPFRYEMSATADIITEDLRLIQRVFYQFRNLFVY